MKNKITNKYIGILYAFLAFVLWGILPFYWKILKEVSTEEILSNRILWSFVFVSILMTLFKQWDKFIITLKNKRNLILIFLCSIMITVNWFTYIWAVNNYHIVDTSFGYYINPLLSVFLGVVVLKEKINKVQGVSLLFAAIGVILIAIQYGKIPWIALTLAVSFGLYGLFKKMLTVDSMTGLTLETAILMPVALAYVLFKQFTGVGALGTGSILTTIMLIGAGIVTATPLLLFAKAAKRVELSTIGFLQYITPTMGLVFGIIVFKENFTSIHLISFGFIWLAIITYSFSNINFNKKPHIETLEEAN